jgi:hypothetical protein
MNEDALTNSILSGQAGRNLTSVALQLAPALPHETSWLPVPVPRAVAAMLFPAQAALQPAPTPQPAPAAAPPTVHVGTLIYPAAAPAAPAAIVPPAAPPAPGAGGDNLGYAVTGRRHSTDLKGVRG